MSVKKTKVKGRVITDLKDLELEAQAQQEHEQQEHLKAAADMYKEECEKSKTPDPPKEVIPPGHVKCTLLASNGNEEVLLLTSDQVEAMLYTLKRMNLAEAQKIKATEDDQKMSEEIDDLLGISNKPTTK